MLLSWSWFDIVSNNVEVVSSNTSSAAVAFPRLSSARRGCRCGSACLGRLANIVVIEILFPIIAVIEEVGTVRSSEDFIVIVIVALLLVILLLRLRLLLRSLIVDEVGWCSRSNVFMAAEVCRCGSGGLSGELSVLLLLNLLLLIVDQLLLLVL